MSIRKESRERGGPEREHGVERVSYTLKEGGSKEQEKGSKKSLPGGGRRKHERVSGRNVYQDMESLGFNSCLDNHNVAKKD